MKLSEIREKYLTLHLSTHQAERLIVESGTHEELARDVLEGWVSDEWARSERAKVEQVARGPTGYVTYKGRQYKVTLEED